jgi:site-specific DNA recombinase
MPKLKLTGTKDDRQAGQAHNTCPTHGGHTMKNAVIYSRVSTEDQRENGTSLESQVAACEKYAVQNDYRVVETFKESRSGASLNRPMLDKVRQMVRDGVVEVVIFYALDRLSRDETDTLILAREFRTHGAELKCATTPLEDTPQGQFLLTLLAAVGKLERAGILERTMRGKRQTARNGRIMGTYSTIYGYTIIDGHYEICEEEAIWVRRVFDWYCIEGLSLYSIQDRLYLEGAPTKKGGRWQKQTVRNILTQEGYLGQWWWGKTSQSVVLPRSEWIGPVPVPPLISRDLYEAARARVEYNKANSPRNCQKEYLLRGLIFCPLCGRRYRAETSKRWGNTHTYYSCVKRARAIPGEYCPSARVNGYRAEEKAWGWVVAHLSDANLMEKLIRGAGDTDKAQRERDASDLKSALKERATIDEDENMQIDLYSKHAINFDKYMERKGVRDERAQGIDTRIADIEARQAARTQAVADMKSALELVQKIQHSMPAYSAVVSFADKRAVLDALHFKATATESGDIHITGVIDDELLALIDMKAGENAVLSQDCSNNLA